MSKLQLNALALGFLIGLAGTILWLTDWEPRDSSDEAPTITTPYEQLMQLNKLERMQAVRKMLLAPVEDKMNPQTPHVVAQLLLANDYATWYALLDIMRSAGNQEDNLEALCSTALLRVVSGAMTVEPKPETKEEIIAVMLLSLFGTSHPLCTCSFEETPLESLEQCMLMAIDEQKEVGDPTQMSDLTRAIIANQMEGGWLVVYDLIEQSLDAASGSNAQAARERDEACNILKHTSYQLQLYLKDHFSVAFTFFTALNPGCRHQLDEEMQSMFLSGCDTQEGTEEAGETQEPQACVALDPDKFSDADTRALVAAAGDPEQLEQVVSQLKHKGALPQDIVVKVEGPPSIEEHRAYLAEMLRSGNTLEEICPTADDPISDPAECTWFPLRINFYPGPLETDEP